MKHIHFKSILIAVSGCLVMTTILTAVLTLSSIKTANASVDVDCYARNDENILFKCNERNYDHCATTYISENGKVTAAICTGDWTQHFEPTPEITDPGSPIPAN